MSMKASIVRQINTGGFTTAEIRGQDEPSALALADAYMGDYPPQGYSTAISAKYYDDNGEYVVLIRRYSSAD